MKVPAASWIALAVAVALCATPRPATAKGGKPASGPPQTGVFALPLEIPEVKYVQMAVPKDYDPSRWYPLFFFLHASDTKPDAWVQAWADDLLTKDWIVAGPSSDLYDNVTSVDPLKRALAAVQEKYRIDERRIVLVGHSAGANMAWCLATADPKPWAAILAMNGEIPSQAQGAVKVLVGKQAYLFTGDKDKYYTADMLARDKSLLDFAKVKYTVEVKKDWASDFPRTSVFAIAQWLETVWPPGSYREKAEATEKALAAKDLSGAMAALKDLHADLKRNPYPAFESKARGYAKAVLDLGRSLIDEAKALLAADPLAALAKMEAAVKAVKGLSPVDKEAAAALSALKKDPAVVAAIKRRDAEALAATYMEKGSAAESKADGAKALEWYRKVVALGETDKKAEALKRIEELEKTVGDGAR